MQTKVAGPFAARKTNSRKAVPSPERSARLQQTRLIRIFGSKSLGLDRTA